MQRCSFCNNSILDYETPEKEDGKVYHKKCYDSAIGSRRGAAEAQKIEEEKKKHEAAFKNQPKVIGEVVVGDKGGGAGFQIDPITGEKKEVSRPGGQGCAPSGIKTQPSLQRK
eukprot:TRINITY_DN2689_c0_g1_i1.p1 TRINITY_DN2689_c0_g1~~TRINITY_DN2689_c0_g1_i1.p1  ORF type:complete len:113 (+),score=27.02 TRINITY_DN2689_c0_g1_i1:37-375(+)